MPNERQLIARLEAAGPIEFQEMLRAPSREEEDAFRTYLGDARFQRMHEMAVLQGTGVRARRELRGNVIVIHGIMGGELTVTRAGARERVWASILRLAMGRIADLALDGHGRNEADPALRVEATGILKKHYGELLLTLSANWNTRAFWYDWRRDLSVAASFLEARATEWFGRDAPFHIVAHSMGGLVARTFIAQYADRWNAMTNGASEPDLSAGGRLIMLGTPNHGSFAVPQILTGIESMVRKLALIDLKHDRAGLQRIVRTFLGSVQMMPSPFHNEAYRPFYETATWGTYGIDADLLAAAYAHHELLKDVIVPARMVYVAGTNRPTLAGIDPITAVGDPRAYAVTFEGDGRVPHALGLLQGVDTYFVDAEHGDLARDARVLAALDDLLVDGRTDSLPARPPATRADPKTAREALERQQQADETELVAFVRRTRRTRTTDTVADSDYLSRDEREAEDLLTRGWLSNPEPEESLPAPAVPVETGAPIVLRVVQGSIGDEDVLATSGSAPAVDAIAVGHYRDVRPTNAEEAIDRAISAALHGQEADHEELVITQLTERGTIPGGLGQPFLIEDPRVKGRRRRVVALAGMGRPGSFGAPELSVLVRELLWGLGRLGSRHLAAVLIGAGNGNIPLATAVRTWLSGMSQALPERPDGGGITHVTFVEFDARRVLDLDAAFRAQLERDPALRNSARYVPLTDEARGALVKASQQRAIQRTERELERLRAGELPSAQDDRTSVPTRVTYTREANGYRMGAITATAAVPEREIPLDSRLVEQANDEIAAERNTMLQHDRGRFLEQLLVPADLREHLTGDAPLVLLLDATTARIHWEMVAQPAPAPGATSMQETDWFLGTARGLTRQLRTTFAPPPEPPPPPRPQLRVLVVADPAQDAHLPGAREEGIFIARLFESFNGFYAAEQYGHIHVERLIGPRSATRTNVLRRIMNARFDVLHFAGHCSYDAEEPSRSGWIFSNGEVLSANELNRIDRIPKFVFSNACESGITPDRSEKRSAGLAPTFAEAFFARGVANFVCTAWPVDDLAARLFALELYAHLLGIDLGPLTDGDGTETRFEPKRLESGQHAMHDAMNRARRRIIELPFGSRTWGAYQHYGNPYFRLFHSRPHSAQPAPRRKPKKT